MVDQILFSVTAVPNVRPKGDRKIPEAVFMEVDDVLSCGYGVFVTTIINNLLHHGDSHQFNKSLTVPPFGFNEMSQVQIRFSGVLKVPKVISKCRIRG
jgi:hypothetical protein